MSQSRLNSVIILSTVTILLGFGVVALSLTLSLGQSQIGIAFVVGGIIAFSLHYSSQSQAWQYSGYKLSQTVFALGLLFAILFAAISGYDRPVWYFVSITIAFIGICSSVFFAGFSRKRAYLLISETFTATLLYRAHRYYQLPTIPGNDTNFHLYLADLLGTGEFSPTAGKYATARAFHWVIGVTRELLGVNPKDALFLGIVVPFAIATVGGLYVITSHLVDRRAGVLAAVLIGISDMFIVRGVTSITPSSIAIISTLGVIYIVSQTRNSHWERLFIFLLVVVSLLSHHLASVIGVILIVSFYITDISAKRIFSWDSRVPIGRYVVICVSLIMALDWMLTPGGRGSLLSGAVFRVLRAISGLGNTSTGYATSLDNYSMLSNWLYQPGYALILALGIAGSILWIHPSRASPTRLLIVSGTAVMGVLIYPLTLVGLDKFFLPHRILVFLVLFLTILAAAVFRDISRRAHGELVAIFLLALIIFFSLTTPYTIRNDPVYNDDRVYRTGLTDSEISTILNGVRYSDSNLYVDTRVVIRSIRFQAYQEGLDRTRILTYPQASEEISEGAIIVTRADISNQVGAGTFGGDTQQPASVSHCLESAHLIRSGGNVSLWYPSRACS